MRKLLFLILLPLFILFFHVQVVEAKQNNENAAHNRDDPPGKSESSQGVAGAPGDQGKRGDRGNAGKRSSDPDPGDNPGPGDNPDPGPGDNPDSDPGPGDNPSGDPDPRDGGDPSSGPDPKGPTDGRSCIPAGRPDPGACPLFAAPTKARLCLSKDWVDGNWVCTQD